MSLELQHCWNGRSGWRQEDPWGPMASHASQIYESEVQWQTCLKNKAKILLSFGLHTCISAHSDTNKYTPRAWHMIVHTHIYTHSRSVCVKPFPLCHYLFHFIATVRHRHFPFMKNEQIKTWYNLKAFLIETYTYICIHGLNFFKPTAYC